LKTSDEINGIQSLGAVMPRHQPADTEHPDHVILRAMFAARKEVFVDLLKWDLPVLADRFELDHFDAEQVEYLILTDLEGHHRASTRLLPTDREHMLTDLFKHLCSKPIPKGPTIREITRFCLDRHQTTLERRSVRNQLVTALAKFALDNGITDYTGVAEKNWFDQIAEFGWDCEALGSPVKQEGRTLCALHIQINEGTIDGLRRKGIYAETGLRLSNLTGVAL
jgi:N-acyl-L-homoserine lactone synthetase